MKLQQKASTVGFDWNDPKAVLAKLREEIDEIEAEIDDATRDADASRTKSATCSSPSSISPAISRSIPTRRFAAPTPSSCSRFAAIEDARWRRRAGHPPEASLDEMEALWQAAKGGAD